MKVMSVLLLLATLLLPACGTDEEPTRTNDFIPLTAIEITAQYSALASHTSQQFTALGNFSGFFTRDITAEVVWTSEDPTVLTFANSFDLSGRGLAQDPGMVLIGASLAGVDAAGLVVTVTDAVIQSVAVTPDGESLPAGLTKQYAATGIFSDATVQDLTFDASWSAAPAAAATVGNTGTNKGLLTAVSPGAVTVAAEFDGVSGSAALTVTAAALESLAIAPANPRVFLFETQQFTASGRYSDGTDQDVTSQVAWSSSLTSVATVSSLGLVATLAPGTSRIGAALEGFSAESVLTVPGPSLTTLAVTPLIPVIGLDTHLQFSATGTFADSSSRDLTAYVTWDTVDATVATISNLPDRQGQALAVAVGSTTVSATLGDHSDSATLRVMSSALQSLSLSSGLTSLADGTETQFSVEGLYLDGTRQDLTHDVTWESSNIAVADIATGLTEGGRLTAIAPGTVTISATSGTLTSSTTVTVTAATLSSISITPSASTLAVGRARQFTATGGFSDGSTQDLTSQATWSSSLDEVATITSDGEARALTAGTTEITVSVLAKTGSVTLSVQ